MAYLGELSKYKEIAIGKLLSDMDLCKAVYYNEQNFLEQENIDDTGVLVYENIFPYRFIPDTQTEMKTFITLTFGRVEGMNNSFKIGKFHFNVFTHRDLFKTDYGSTRVDYIVSKIDKMFNYKNTLGIGKLKFGHLDEIAVNDKFIGVSICYVPVEFNR